MPSRPVSKNVARLNADLHRELIEIIGEMKDPRLKTGLVTITRVEASSDLSICRVFVSVLGEEGPAGVVAALDRAKGHIRSEVSKRMHIRRSPEFVFIEDDNAAYADHINHLLREIEPHE